MGHRFVSVHRAEEHFPNWIGPDFGLTAGPASTSHALNRAPINSSNRSGIELNYGLLFPLTLMDSPLEDDPLKNL